MVNPYLLRRQRVSDAFYIYSRVIKYAEFESEPGCTIQLLIRPIQAFQCTPLFDEFLLKNSLTFHRP